MPTETVPKKPPQFERRRPVIGKPSLSGLLGYPAQVCSWRNTDLVIATLAPSKRDCPWNFPITAALEHKIAVQGTYRVNSAELYRANAAECLVMASSITDANNRKSLLDMASAWLRLADLAEKNGRTDLVYETPPPQPRTIR